MGGLLLAAILLTGCGAQSHDSHGTATEPAGHNQADVDFARMMIPHHEGAVEMAKLAPGRSTAQRVLDLAAASSGRRTRRSSRCVACSPDVAHRPRRWTTRCRAR